jgi:transposase InsO family protein
VSHAHAALTPRHRLKLARAVVDAGWTISYVAAVCTVSWPTAKRWAQRYRQAGEAGTADRPSRPHRSSRRTPQPRTPQPIVRKIAHLRWKKRLGPVAIADRLGLAPATVHAMLVRCRINRLAHIDRRTGETARRYEHDRPGALIHVDVKKLGNIPDGGGWRYVGRARGKRHRAATPGKPRTARRDPKMDTAFVHTVLDDHSRVAYAEIHDGETAATAMGVLRRAVAHFAARDITADRVLSDNGSAYRSRAWRQACAELGHHAPPDPAPPAPDQRQDRALPPHPRRRLGLRPDVPQRVSPPKGPAGLAARVQPSPAPHRDRTPPTDHPIDQPVRAVHLARSQCTHGISRPHCTAPPAN